MLPRLTLVTATATGGTNGNIGVYNYNNSSPVMTNVTATASGASYSYGVYNDSSSPVIKHSKMSGATNSVTQDGTWTVKLAYTEVSGPLSPGIQCLGNYNENLAPVTCP